MDSEVKCSPKRSMAHEEREGSKRICLDDEVEIRFLIASKVANLDQLPPLRTSLTTRSACANLPSGFSVLSLSLSRSQDAGAIIGKSGANINSLRKSVNATERFRKLWRTNPRFHCIDSDPKLVVYLATISSRS